MSSRYFNYSTFWPNGYWDRRSFVRAWWRIYSDDPRWVPPDFSAFNRFVHGIDQPFARRVHLQPIYMEALPLRSRDGMPDAAYGTRGVTFETPVAAALLQVDRRPRQTTAYLSLLHCANDEETLERLLGKAMEWGGEHGCTRFVGPVGPVPGFQSGLLQDHFHLLPPIHTPYGPPYLPELFDNLMEPVIHTALYHYTVPPAAPSAPSPARLVPWEQIRSSGSLSSVWAEVFAADGIWPQPDQQTVAILLQWLAGHPIDGWVATVDEMPVALLLVQADLSPLVRLSGGGRLWHWRALAALRKKARFRAGRLVVGSVAPAWRGKGIGLQLWRQLVTYGIAAGWQTITCGPLTADSAAARFLTRQGLQRQTALCRL